MSVFLKQFQAFDRVRILTFLSLGGNRYRLIDEHRPSFREVSDLCTKKRKWKKRRPPKNAEFITEDDMAVFKAKLQESESDQHELVICFISNRIYFLRPVSGSNDEYEAVVKWITDDKVEPFLKLLYAEQRAMEELLEKEIEKERKLEAASAPRKKLVEAREEKTKAFEDVAKQMTRAFAFSLVGLFASEEAIAEEERRKKSTGSSIFLDTAVQMLVVNESEMPRKVKKQEPEQRLKTEFDAAILESEESRRNAVAEIVKTLQLLAHLPEDLKSQALFQIDRNHLDEFNKDIESTKRRRFHEFVFGSQETKPTVTRAQKWLAEYYEEQLETDEKFDLVDAVQWLRNEKKFPTFLKTADEKVECRVGTKYLNSRNIHCFRFRNVGQNDQDLRVCKIIPQELKFKF